MRKVRGSSRLAIALAAGLALAGAGTGAATAEAKEAKPAKGPAYSKEFVAAAGPLQQAIAAAQAAQARNDAAGVQAAVAGAPAMLSAAQVAARSPDEQLAVGQLAVQLGNFNKDQQLQLQGLKAMIASGRLDPAKQAELQGVLGKIAYSNKDYATAQSALAGAVAAGSSDDQLVEILIDSYARGGNPQAGLGELRKIVAARRAANRPVPEAWLKRADITAYNAKLSQEAVDWATLHAELYPTSFNWLGSTQLIRRFSPGWTAQENLDLFRLMARAGAFNNDPKIVGNEYREYIEAADARRNPGEVVKIIDQGVASGALTSSGGIAEARALAAGRIAADKASLPSLERGAHSGTGVSALAAADAFLNYGEAAKAEELYRLALSKGGIDKDRALTRLGIAQVDQGKWAEAQATFKQIGGMRAPLARLWLVYIAQKSGARAG